MEHKQRILSLLGLALRGGNLAVGEEPVETAAEGCRARLILLAADAAAGSCRKAERFAQIGNCIWLRAPFTKAELGRAVGRASAAMAAVTDIGLAAAAGRRLAEMDPAEYGAVSERLELKNKRAAERKAEQRIRDQEARRARKKTPELPETISGRCGKPGSPKRQDRPGKPPERAAGRPAGRQSGRPEAGGARKTAPPGKSPERAEEPARNGKPAFRRKPDSRAGGRNRPKPRANPYAHSHPVKKGKGSFRKREG